MKTIRLSPCLLAAALALALPIHASAQQHDHAAHEAPKVTDHGAHAQPAPPAVHVHTAEQPPEPATQDHGGHAGMDHSQHGATPPIAPTEPKEAIPALTDADRAAAFPQLKPHAMEHAPATQFLVMFNRLEGWNADHGDGQAWEGSAWIGTDLDRLWLRTEGEREDGRTASSELEVLYGRAVSPWWDVVVGVKQDFRPADSRTWAAFGVQGLAPYKFEVSATAYLGESGQVAASIEAEYELLLTNRLILQPLVEASFSAKDEPEYGNGSGLNKVEAGLRLRYEINRRFAPYVGVVHERLFGGTADYHREAGEDSRDTRVVAGVRVWF